MKTRVVELPVKVETSIAQCERCLTELRQALEKVSAIRRVDTLPDSGGLLVVYDGSLSAADLGKIVSGAVSDLAARYDHIAFFVDGLTCQDCAREIERAVLAHGGVVSASINLGASSLKVEIRRADVAVGEILSAVESVGYGASLKARARFADSVKHFLRGLPARTVRESAAAALLLVAAAALALGGVEGVFVHGLLTASAVAGGYRMAWHGLAALVKERSLNINLLIAIAGVGAIGLGEVAEAALLVLLFSLGELLEEISLDRTRRSLESLLDRAPVMARVVAGGDEDMRPAGRVTPGDRISVRPGEVIPADGVVAEGRSTVSQAALTGEPLPLPRGPGDEVYAGTLNGPGHLLLVADRAGTDSRLARMIDMVQESQARKAPVQRWVDRFAGVYTPIVVAVAAALAVIPPVFFERPWDEWIFRGLVMLVVACPCALVISTPVAMASALASAFRNGVLVKGGAYLEALGRLDGVVFDKTGTLTLGSPAVRRIVPLGARTEREVLALAAGLEAQSQHPIARAIRLEAARRGVEPQGPITDMALSDLGGVQGWLNGEPIRTGTPRFLESHGLDVVRAQELLPHPAPGEASVLVAVGGEIVGAVALHDPIRPGAAAAVAALKRAGVRHMAILTGDSAGAAAVVGESVAIADVRAGLMPEDKVRAVQELRRAARTLAMVGDGVNDAPALAEAGIGVAMGAVGSDAAIETADVALMTDNLARLPALVGLAKRNLRTVRVNIAVALGSKLVFLVLAGAGIATLWMAVLADVGASLAVIAFSMRLLRHDWRVSATLSVAHDHQARGQGAHSASFGP